jgi:hypothetical protein
MVNLSTGGGGKRLRLQGLSPWLPANCQPIVNCSFTGGLMRKVIAYVFQFVFAVLLSICMLLLYLITLSEKESE